MLRGTSPPPRRITWGKILITLVVVVAVGAAVLIVSVAVSHDRFKEERLKEVPALYRDDFKLMDP